MEKVIFTDPDTKEKIEFYVLEETQINGKKISFCNRRRGWRQ